MASLKEKKCLPCQGGVPPLDAAECRRLLCRLNFRWNLNEKNDRLLCSLKIPGFPEDILRLLRKIGELSEAENHHPELRWRPGCLDVQIWTHKIGALVESDFILAAKIDDILAKSGISVTFILPKWADGRERPSLTESHRSWSASPEKDVFFRRFPFDDFDHPWKCALRLLETDADGLAGDFEFELGYGHLGVTVRGSRGTDFVDKIVLSRIDRASDSL